MGSVLEYTDGALVFNVKNFVENSLSGEIYPE